MESGLSLQTRRELLQQVISQYREVTTVKKKSKLLDAFTATTCYNRKYAMWLLNHAKVGQSTPQHTRPRRYGPEVQHFLFLVWHAANRICVKRLMPFLPTLIEALERHEHLHLTEECRKQLLSMSAATADRLLRSQRKRGQRGLSTTRAGTLLKQQIPIRTFQEWKETQPGLTFSGPGGPLWCRHRGRLPVYPDAHRCSTWLDRMSAPLASERGAGAGCPSTRTHALPFSHAGD